MSSGGGSKGKSKGKNKVTIPSFLQPFINQTTSTAGSALSNAQSLAGGQSVAPFNEAQQLAQMLGIEEATNGQFIPAAQETLLNATQGQSIADFLDPATIAALRGSAGGQGLDSFIDPGALSSLSNLSQTGEIAGSDALSRTAAGDFLYGGPGFDQAVEAAVRAARPGIISTFGRAGAGGATGGLSQTAVGTAGVDAFARQFAQERQNQLAAAGKLGDTSAGASGLLAGLSDSERGRALQSAGLLGEFGSTERGRQLTSASILPDIGTAGINLLSNIGGQQQDLAQQQIDAPFMRQIQLLSAALGGLPIESLLGSKSKGSQRGVSLGFGG